MYFFHDGLCELHDKGLKPTEGRLSHHSMRLDNWSPKKSISWNVAKEWEDEENAPVLEEIYELLKRTGIITKTATASDDTDGLESGGNGGDNNGSQQGGGTDNGGSEEGDQN